MCASLKCSCPFAFNLQIITKFHSNFQGLHLKFIDAKIPSDLPTHTQKYSNLNLNYRNFAKCIYKYNTPDAEKVVCTTVTHMDQSQ